MAMQLSSRSLLTKTLISSLLSRSLSSCPLPQSHRPLSLLRTALRPLSSAVAATAKTSAVSRSSTAHSFSTRATSSSLNDPSPNWSNRPPKETILLDGCDFEHWLVVLEKPDENMTRDDIIDSYIKTLAKVIGSEEEARMKIYSVSTKHYFAFGALVSEELSNKIKELPGVRDVLPDSYLDVKNKDYGGEPFINGQAVPYDPQYHEEWVRNNAKANERNRRNDNRPAKETILLDGCDFEHWLVVLEKPDENMTRDDIIDSYIKTLATVIGSEEEARMKIYSVSTKHYFAFGALVPEELSKKIKELPGVRYVLPDSYLDEKNKDYGGEPFINGQAVPYDPKYHEEWV